MIFPWRKLSSLLTIKNIRLEARQARIDWHRDWFLARDPFTPTTGRWLWNEPCKRQEHTREFDISALEHAIVNAAGSTAGITVRLKKIAEGGSNKVFLAVVGKQRLIVKIPDPEVPPRLATASEVATLQFVRPECSIPASSRDCLAAQEEAIRKDGPSLS